MLEYKKPRCTNEVVIQSELYHACKEASLTCDLEYVCYTDKGEKCVLDLIVIENRQIIAIVELKTIFTIDDSILAKNSEQIKRYKQFGVPIFILYFIQDIPRLVKKLVGIQKKYLRSIKNTIPGKCNESDKLSEKRQEELISAALDEFNKAFPNYEFTYKHSLGILASAVKILSLEWVIQIIDASREKGVEDFFFQLDCFLQQKKEERLGNPNVIEMERW
jgi:hypothetical protein